MALVPELAESHNARQSPKAKWCQLQERLHDAVAQLALLRKNHPPQEPSSATSTPTFGWPTSWQVSPAVATHAGHPGHRDLATSPPPTTTSPDPSTIMTLPHHYHPYKPL
ncbi:unnamed protein product [Lampetra planeri]